MCYGNAYLVQIIQLNNNLRRFPIRNLLQHLHILDFAMLVSSPRSALAILNIVHEIVVFAVAIAVEVQVFQSVRRSR